MQMGKYNTFSYGSEGVYKLFDAENALHIRAISHGSEGV